MDLIGRGEYRPLVSEIVSWLQKPSERAEVGDALVSPAPREVTDCILKKQFIRGRTGRIVLVFE